MNEQKLRSLLEEELAALDQLGPQSCTWTGVAALAPQVAPCGCPSASCPEPPRAPVLC